MENEIETKTYPKGLMSPHEPQQHSFQNHGRAVSEFCQPVNLSNPFVIQERFNDREYYYTILKIACSLNEFVG